MGKANPELRGFLGREKASLSYAKDYLIEPLTYEYVSAQYLPLARQLARKFVITGKVELADLMQEAQLAFLEVVKDYDASRGRLGPYVYARLLGVLSEYARRNKHQVYIPGHLAKALAHCERMIAEIYRAGKEEYLQAILSTQHHEQDTEELTSIKRKLSSLARNANLTYQELMLRVSFPEEFPDEYQPREGADAPASRTDRRQSDERAFDPSKPLIASIDHERALAKLSPLYRATLSLRWQGYSLEETATLLAEAKLTPKRYTRQTAFDLERKANARLQFLLGKKKDK